MNNFSVESFPFLVSIIIPCYNHGNYLAEAIDSLHTQTYNNLEIIVVDDGSTDNTREVAEKYSDLNYVYQTNQGLSAARNTGIKHSRGKYLVFLDADDWLFPKAIEINVSYLNKNETAGFVSGAHQKINRNGVVLENETLKVDENHYQHLLQGNYIGMHATVLYQRWIFDFFSFDETLKACEDYDLYLKIARNYPVIHHQKLIAAYRIHDSNMSGNIPLMLDNTLMVLQRQKPYLVSKVEKHCYKNGLTVWKNYYCEKVYLLLRLQPLSFILSKREYIKMLFKYQKKYFFKMFARKLSVSVKRKLKERFHPDVPAVGKINLGDFNRVTPFSTQFGYDRGGPVDRYYIENFLQKHEALIQGRALEIGDNEYTLKYGKSKIQQTDILHIDENNDKATFVGDLSNAPHLPDNSFDCIILTQTLHLIYHHHKALETCNRILKPGGVLLLTVPGISHIDQGEWKDIWLWAFTESSIRRMLAEVFTAEKTKVETFGNVFSATAFLFGMGLLEVKKSQLDFNDPHYQVIITACAVKPEL
jgi:glycosyltransferase involved in cell wall biosynthesis